VHSVSDRYNMTTANGMNLAFFGGHPKFPDHFLSFLKITELSYSIYIDWVNQTQI